MSPLTHCPYCHADLPPFTNGCPSCRLRWRELRTDDQVRREQWIGAIAALIWTALSLLILTTYNVPVSRNIWIDPFFIAVLLGYPGTLAILALFGCSRNKGYAAFQGGILIILWVAAILSIATAFSH